MAQLKDDCFAFGGDLTPLHDALAAMRERVNVVAEPQMVPVDQALGRILCEDIVAPRNVPPHDNSAVDGYAVYFDDLDAENETRLPYTGRIAAGHPLGRHAVSGEALRIFTGAPMPVGADGDQASGPDTVFMEEDVSVEGGMVILPPGLKRGANRRDAGEDIREESVILKQGRRLRPQDLGLAASVGFDTLSVYSPLRVAIFSTGDEIRDPSGDAPEGCVFDANRFTVKGLLGGLGCAITDLGIMADDQTEIEHALCAAADTHDLLITSGGVSAGEEDHVKSAVEAYGTIHHWRLAIKPGRPIALGQVGGTAFVGLPGNPVAAMVTFMVLARPLVLWLSGASNADARRFQVTAAFDYKKKTGRREWARVRLEQDADGPLTAHKDHSSGAGILTSMVGADGLVELPEDVEAVSPGDQVLFLPFSEVTG